MPKTPPSPATSSAPASLLARVARSIMSPPFAGLPIAICLYFIVSFFIHPESALRTQNLPDADDYMYLAQVADWLAGQNWFDNVQHRLDPAARVAIDFSRLAQLPMALMITLLAPFFGKTGAGLVMAMVLPVLELFPLLLLLRWIAHLAMNPAYSRATAFVTLFASYLIYQFSPGHIDHHGLTALLVLAGFGCAARSGFAPEQRRWPFGAGLILSLALAVGLEVLPPLILISGWMGLLAILRGGLFARSALIYGLSLTLGSLVWLGITAPMDKWLEPDPLGYSIVYVIFCASLALCFAGVALASKTKSSPLRYIAGGLLAAITGYLFLGSFPQLIGGPYGAMDKDLASFMFATIPEAVAIIRPSSSMVEIFLHLLWPIMGLAATLWFWRRAETTGGRWFWFLNILLLGAHTALAAFYQIRFLVLAQMFTIIPLTALLAHICVWLEHRSKGFTRRLLQAEAVLLIAPLPMLIFPFLVMHEPFWKGILLFPVQTAEFACDMHSLAAELNRAEQPQLIMNDMASGPELMFRTQHIVLSAPFHTNVAGNLDAEQFFTASTPATAKAILQKRGANLVVICKSVAKIYSPKDTHAPPNLAAQLVKGETPDWLTPIHYVGENDYLLFAVRND